MADYLLTRAQMNAIPGPAICLSDNLGAGFWSSFFAWGIREHEQGFYNHAFCLLAPGRCVSQNWKCEQEPLSDYLDGKHRVKIWAIKGLTEYQSGAIRAALVDDARAGRRYNWVGIIGQWTGWRSLGLPGRDYCSEYAAQIMRMFDPDAAAGLGDHPAPSEIDAFCKLHPERYYVAGIFDPYQDAQ